jgi:hypothetical protein
MVPEPIPPINTDLPAVRQASRHDQRRSRCHMTNRGRGSTVFPQHRAASWNKSRVDGDASQEKDAAPKPAIAPRSGGAPDTQKGSGMLPEVGELAVLLREIRDRLPPPAGSPPRPGRLRRLGRLADAWVRAAEPWSILLAIVALLVGLITFWTDYLDRVEERTVRAWQVVTARAPGNSGKGEALAYLNKEEDGLLCFEVLRGRLAWLHGDAKVSCMILLKRRTPLTGIDLSPPDNATPSDWSDDPPGAYLVLADLAGADLNDANLAGANLWKANLAGADLWKANLAGADLWTANLAGADLREANLAGGNLSYTDFTATHLSEARFWSEEAGTARYLTQAQIDRAWAWADESPSDLDRLAPPLALPKFRLCDPKLRPPLRELLQRPRGEKSYGPPAACSGAAGADAGARSGGDAAP